MISGSVDYSQTVKPVRILARKETAATTGTSAFEMKTTVLNSLSIAEGVREGGGGLTGAQAQVGRPSANRKHPGLSRRWLTSSSLINSRNNDHCCRLRMENLVFSRFEVAA